MQLYNLHVLDCAVRNMDNKPLLYPNNDSASDVTAFSQAIRQFSGVSTASISMLRAILSILQHMYKQQYEVIKHFPFQLQKSYLNLDFPDQLLDTVYVHSNAVIPSSGLNGIAVTDSEGPQSPSQYVKMKCPAKNIMIAEAYMLSSAIVDCSRLFLQDLNTANSDEVNILMSKQYVIKHSDLGIQDLSSSTSCVLTLGTSKIWQEVCNSMLSICE